MMIEATLESEMTSAGRGGRSLWARVGVLAGDIKLSHTVFALPFAVLGAALAGAERGYLPGVLEWGLVLLCMVTARTAAMAFNRWADAHFDTVNPRARGRAIPSGRLTPGFMLGVVIACSLAFVVAAGGFWVVAGNPYPLIASPVVLLWLLGYSYTKRFTAGCHLYLGVVLALSPLAAALAVEPGYLGQWPVYLLAGVVAFWVAGFDVIYALQDVATDRETGLFSLPSRIGECAALWISRTMHVVSFGLMVALCFAAEVLGTGFAFGVGIAGVLMITEHVIVARQGRSGVALAFAPINGVVSLVVGVLGVVDVVGFVQRI